MPASTILLLASDADAGRFDQDDPVGRRVRGDRDRRPRTRPSRRSPSTSSSSSTRRAGRSPRSRSAGEIRAAPSMSAVPVMCVSATDDVEERIAFLEAGADDVMARPFDAREMEARVEALLLRFQRSKDLGPIISADGLTLARARRTVAVYSPKGGVGTTTSRRTSRSRRSPSGPTGSCWWTSRSSSAASRRCSTWTRSRPSQTSSATRRR